MHLHLWPAQERPREKLLAQGAQALSDAELLALLLGSSGMRGSNVVDLARTLVGYCRMQAALELAHRHYAQAMRCGPLLDSPAATHQFLISRLRDQSYELFYCLYLYTG
jgi:DNA repair protein RadC